MEANEDPFNDFPLLYAENEKVENERRSSRTISGPLMSYDSLEHSDGDEGPLEKRARDELDERREQIDDNNVIFNKLYHNTTPKCVLCEAHPTTTYLYSEHLYNQHKSTLMANGIYLFCSCGIEIRSHFFKPNHSKRCEGRRFTLHKLGEKIPSTPQCVLCDAHPTTVCRYAQHLYVHNKSTLKQNGIYLLCSCGEKIGSSSGGVIHNKKCHGLQFTIHKLPPSEKFGSAPQCLFCEVYPRTALGYAEHLFRHDQSTLQQNGIYLLCACGIEVRSTIIDPNHKNNCERKFKILRLIDN